MHNLLWFIVAIIALGLGLDHATRIINGELDSPFIWVALMLDAYVFKYAADKLGDRNRRMGA